MNDNKRSAKRKWKNALIAAALTASVILALPGWSVGTAEAAPVTTTDPTKIQSTLTIQRNGTTVKNQGAITVDLYKVANAEKLDGYDAYELVVPKDSEFVSLETDLQNAQEAANKKTKPVQDASGNDLYKYNEAYRALANEAAKIVFGNGNTATKAYTVTLEAGKTSVSIPEGENGSKVAAGLYLVIAHDETLPKDQYVKYVGEGNDRQLITIAENNGYVYNYYPELIALPLKAANGNAPQGIFTTAQDAGEWQDAATVQLKAEEEAPMHDLTITKNITIPDNYPANIAISDAFVYRVDVYLGGEDRQLDADGKLVNGRLIDSHIATISYESNNRQVKLEKAIPDGAMLVITEDYEGSSFNVNGNITQIIGPIYDNQNVAFSNTYNGRPGGGAVENRFEVEEGRRKETVTQTPVAGTVVTP